MKILIPMALALLAGALLPFQAGINAQLRGHLGAPMSAALVSFTVGTLALLVVLLISRSPLPSNPGGVPWWQWIGGGLLGASYLILSIVLTPILGVALTFGLIVAGQLAMSLALDQFGAFGLVQHGLNGWRALGALLIVAGVVLIRKF